MNALFTADSICKRFGERQVLNSASIWAAPGRITALLGRNGCGKTTLLLADEPFQGIAPRDAELLVTAFRGLAADGCAIIVTGHEVRTVLDLADEVIWMVAGTTHYFGSAAAAERNDGFRRDYLGPGGLPAQRPDTLPAAAP